MNFYLQEIRQLQEQLAAEKEKAEKAAARAELAQITMNTANVAMMKAVRVAEDYEKQLAAEREAGKALMQMHREAVDKCNEARDKIASEQEKVGKYPLPDGRTQ